MFMQNLIDDYITPMVEDTQCGLWTACWQQSDAWQAFTHWAWYVPSFTTLSWSQVTQGTLRALRDEMFVHMEELPIQAILIRMQHGDIMSIYTNDIDALRQMISQSIPQMVNSGVTIIGVIVCMIRLSIPLTLVTLGMVAIMLLVTKVLGRKFRKIFWQAAEKPGDVSMVTSRK